MCGSNNQTPGTHTSASGGLIAGYNNNVKSVTGAAICLGGNNRVYGNNQIFIGYDNNAQGSTSVYSICLGRGLIVSNNNLKQKVVLGTYNVDAASLSSEKGKLQTVVGGGDSDNLGHRFNAVEVYTGLNSTNSCCVIFPQQIALSNYTTSNKAYVNAITAPPDPDNLTTDDQTLVTKSYRRNLPAQLTNDLVNNQSTSIANGATLNLETDFSITFPDWTELIKIGITNSGGYMDYITMAADVNKSYVSVTGAGTIDVYSYNASTKDFTFVSGGSSASILSIRAEGKTTI